MHVTPGMLSRSIQIISLSMMLLVVENGFVSAEQAKEGSLSRSPEVEKKLEVLEQELSQQQEEIRDLKRRLEETGRPAQQPKVPGGPGIKNPDGVSQEAGSVTTLLGKVTFKALAQVWFAGSSRDTNTTFRLRRMELYLGGEIIPKVEWNTMIDPAKTATLNQQGTTFTVNQGSNILQNLYLTYKLHPLATVDIGQFKVPLSMEGLRSSAALYTVERAIFNVLPLPNGRVGDIRDVGLQLRGTTPVPIGTEGRAEYAIGVFNEGGGIGQNTVDTNDQKAFIGRVALFPVKDLRIGVYGGRSGTKNVARDRLGGELSCRWGPHVVEAEYVSTKDAPPAVTGRGWYGLYAYDLTPQWQVVARYEEWDPDIGSTRDLEQDVTVGLNYLIERYNVKFQVNYVHKDIDDAAPSHLGRTRDLVLVNAQVSF
jgi:hypothetical protein